MTYEPADGQLDRLTGLHIDHGDGSATWLPSGQLDLHSPAGSGKTWREIGERARDDAKALPKSKPPVEPKKAPSAEEFERAEKEKIK